MYAAIGASLDDVDTAIMPPVNGGSAERPSTAPASPAITHVPSDPEDDTPTTRRWYVGPIILSDFVALGLVGLAASSGHSGYLAASSIAYFGAGPVIHATHQRWGAAVGSLVLRVSLPVLGGTIGGSQHCATNGDHDDGLCPAFGELIGVTVGVLLASGIDIGALSWEPVPKSPVIAASFQWSVAPVVDARTGSKGPSIVGTF